MAEPVFRSIELLPSMAIPRQLFILLHGVGANRADLLPLAQQLRKVYPDAAYLLAEGTYPCDTGGDGRQWFPVSGVTEQNRPARIAEAMPALHTLVRQAQDRFNVLPTDTALLGFSQGGIMALEFGAAHDGSVGRILVFSGRYAELPEHAPELITIHLLHGERDPLIPVEHAYAAYEKLVSMKGDVTIDVASTVGHELHEALVERAISRLQTCVPLRSWKRAMEVNLD